MLINLSNHHTATWSAAQRRAAAAVYGRYVDLPFPEIPPEADTVAIEALARTYVAQCLALLPPSAVGLHAVHAMGEATFVHAVVQGLHRAGVRCIASTTQRSEVPEGTAQAAFQFVRFRAYPCFAVLSPEAHEANER